MKTFMTYEQFKQELLCSLSLCFPEDTQVKLEEVIKNNDLRLDGLLISDPTVNISPTIYVNSFYEQYQNGACYDDIVEKIVSCYQEHRLSESMDTAFFSDYDQVRPNVVLKLISQQHNQTLLADIPFIPFLDLAIVFCYYISSNQLQGLTDASGATILIHNDHLALWQVTPAQLYHHAKQNTPKLLPLTFCPLGSLFRPMVERGELTGMSVEDLDVPLFLLTNVQRFLGASTLLYPQVLKHIAEELDDDLIIIPSSIHELLLLPYQSCGSLQELTDLVMEVNGTQVAPEELLSDHIYIYERCRDEVCVG